MTDQTKAVWTAELTSEAIAMYIERVEAFPEDERPNHTISITEAIASELGFKPNSVRARLSKAKRADGTDVYIRKVRAKTTTAKAGGTATVARMSKADAQAELTNTLTKQGATITEDLTAIIEKLTGKAAQHLVIALLEISEGE